MRHPVVYTHFGYDFLDWTGEAYHPGVDFNNGSDDLNDPVYPYLDGEIIFVQRSNKGYGNMVVVEHSNGLYSKYAHLNDLYVEVGDDVTEMVMIGRIGTTGASSAPHLHFEIFDEFIWNLGANSYPNGKSKDYVQLHYSNPHDIVEKSMRNIKITFVNSRMEDSLKIWTDNQCIRALDWIEEREDVKFEYHFVDSKDEVEWTGNYVDAQFVTDRVIPLGGGSDIVVLLVDAKDWKSMNTLAYANAEKYLGSQIICNRVNKGGVDPRFRERFEGEEFPSVLVHEICHSFYAMQGNRYGGHGDMEHAPGTDNTHYFDYVSKDLSKVFDEVDPKYFKMFDVPGMVRFFHYKGYYSKKRIPFSGETIIGQIYRTDTPFLYFEYTAQGWKIIDEELYEIMAHDGRRTVIMSMQEGLWIYDQLGVEIPEFVGKHIIDTTANASDTWRITALKLQGWKTTLPTNHLI